MKKTVCGSCEDKRTWIYQTDNGMYIRETKIEAKNKPQKPIKIFNIADIHINLTNKDDESNEEIMNTKKHRLWMKDGQVIDVLNKALDYAEKEGFDQTVISGDTLDYLSRGAMEAMDRLIWQRDKNVIVALGGHDITREMETGEDDKTPIEDRWAILKTLWRHDMFYYSKVLDNCVMIIQLDNGRHMYYKNQIEKLRADLQTAREKGYVVLIFQHEPISTGKPEDKYVKTFMPFGSDGENFYDTVIGDFQDFDDNTKAVYHLLCESADVIKGIFCGHCHGAYYMEIKASYKDENGKKCPAVIPQYIEEVFAGDDFLGHTMEITVY